MFAQITEVGTTQERYDELVGLVRAAMIPALLTETGFSGALCLGDRGRGRAVVLVLWETEDQARLPASRHGAKLVQAIGKIDEITLGGPASTSVWEVDLEL